MGNCAGRKYAKPASRYYSNASNERLFTSDGRGAVSTIKNFGHRRLIKNFCPTKARVCMYVERVFFFFFTTPTNSARIVRWVIVCVFAGNGFAMKEIKLDESN